ncbi:ABC transporter ATP-binding protein [Dactylosporangium siamense]|uniref:ABC transporter ATP-binding protein n=1 Tax=Dactylosporangium siamense TaxID=685454 RepID=A0A919UE32_9ACTN|nr:ABC transporter ATP-binding protein [Dactylosporangium siamense]GIG52137.1 ABC transporter ATP-binding protein [Dactylosporangium siamense]
MTAITEPGLALQASGLGKRYGSTWALRDVELAVPEGRVIALVGPNGAGKTTLLHLAMGLTVPTAGEVRVQGGLAAGSLAALSTVGFVAQDAALYPNLSVADTIHLAHNLNTGFDVSRAHERIAELDVPLGCKVGKLSGGQRAQVALTLALAKRPRLLILDEPLSSLDPLARHDFMAALMAAVAEDGISVLYSSHVVSELERVSDYLVVLSGGRVQLADEVDDVLGTHWLYTGPVAEADRIAADLPVLRDRRTDVLAYLLVRSTGPQAQPPHGWEATRVGLEELVLAYLRKPRTTVTHGALELTAKGTAL